MSERLEAYLATLPKLAAGKARAALIRQQGFSGKVYARHAFAERLAERGGGVRVDLAASGIGETGRTQVGRVYTGQGDRFYSIQDVTMAFAKYLDWLLSQGARA